MTSLKTNRKGFTVIEILIVLLVIGFLVFLVVRTYGGIQARSRDDQRQTDIQKIQGQLISFYSQNGYYPSLKEMNSPKWLATNMKSLSPSLLVDPLSSCNPSATGCLVAKPKPKAYAYAVYQIDGVTSCESDAMTCAVFTLTATFEGTINGSTTYSKHNY